MKKETWYFIVNPQAGGGRVKKNWPKLKLALKAQRVSFDFIVTEARGHACPLVYDALELGYRHFVVVGGDGSVNEVVNAIMIQSIANVEDIVLNIVPWGTGNDWAAYHGISKKMVDCIQVLKQPNIIQQDLGRVSYSHNNEKKYHWFINFVGAGMDSYVLEKMQKGGGSRLNYYKAALKSLFHYRSPVFSLNVNKEKVNVRSMMLMACNGKFGGAGMIFAPEAKVDDGLLNILSIADMSTFKRLLSFRYLLTGKINRHPKVMTHISSALSIDSDQPIIFQCDGELVGHLPIEIKCFRKIISIAI